MGRGASHLLPPSITIGKRAGLWGGVGLLHNDHLGQDGEGPTMQAAKVQKGQWAGSTTDSQGHEGPSPSRCCEGGRKMGDAGWKPTGAVTVRQRPFTDWNHEQTRGPPEGTPEGSDRGERELCCQLRFPET